MQSGLKWVSRAKIAPPARRAGKERHSAVPLTRIDLCTDGLDSAIRETLLEIIYETLRISPGMVSADGNFELTLTRCAEDPDDAPVVRLNGLPYIHMTPDRLRDLLRRRQR